MPCMVVQKVTNGMAGIQTKQNWQYYIYICIYTSVYIHTQRKSFKRKDASGKNILEAKQAWAMGEVLCSRSTLLSGKTLHFFIETAATDYCPDLGTQEIQDPQSSFPLDQPYTGFFDSFS